MKKLLLVFLSLFLLSSCAQGDTTPNDAESTTAPPSAESSETQEQETSVTTTTADETEPSETEVPTPDVPVEEPVEEEFVLRKERIITVSAEKLDAEDMKYTNTRVKNPIENDMYTPIVFYGDYIYYVKIVYSDDDNPDALFRYYRHNIESCESEYLFEVPFSNAVLCFEVVNDHLICGVKDEIMTVYSYDLKANTGEPDILLTFQKIKGVGFDIARLSDTEAIFLVDNIDVIDSENYPNYKVYIYNTETDELTLFFETYPGSVLTDLTELIYGVEARDGRIYFLMYTVEETEKTEEGVGVYKIVELNRDGEILSERYLYDLIAEDLLYEYPSLASTSKLVGNPLIEQFQPFNDEYLLVFDWFKIMESAADLDTKIDDGLPWEIFLFRWDGTEYVDMEIGQYEPQLMGYKGEAFGIQDDRYIVMGSKSEIIDLLIIDTVEDIMIPIELDVDEELVFDYENIVMNEDGDIVMIGQIPTGRVTYDDKEMYMVNLHEIMDLYYTEQASWIVG